MGRRTKVKEREILPDPKFNSVLITKFINKMMYDGKKSKAEKIISDAFEIIEKKIKKNPKEVFEKAIENVKPQIEVKSKRVGGSTYQVPMEVPVKKQNSLAMKWIIGFSRSRSEKSMAQKLAGELMDAFEKQGNSIKKKEDTHRMAEANRAFAHFKWS
jgi:small subunit ribosomal protein S7